MIPSLELSLVAAFAAAALFGLVVTPVVIRMAFVIGAVDQPNERKTHAKPMPRLGGVAVLGSLVVGLLVLFLINPALLPLVRVWGGASPVIALALLLMLGLGIWDDIRTLGPGVKFLAQLAIASLVYFAGSGIKFISFPNAAGLLELDLLQYAVTVLWIIGVTNAVNLIDGLDGLASGVGMIACLTIAPIAYLNGDTGTAVLALLLAGALAGFLKYNFNPAKIFLGDSGSLVLGFALAVLSIKSSTKASTAFAIVIPILALGLPIMETLLSMLRRLLKSALPGASSPAGIGGKLKSMFLPDNGHIHHRLIAAGYSHKKAVVMLYVVSCALGAGAFALSVVHNVTSSLILIVVGGAVVLGVRQLRYTEMAVLKNGMLLPLYDREFLNRETFQGFADVFFIIASFVIAAEITGSAPPVRIFLRDIVIMVAIVCPIQFTVLLLSGLYKGSMRYMGLREVIRTTAGVAEAVIATSLLLTFVVTTPMRVGLDAILLDFYILASCIVGSRISFSVLKHFSLSPAKEGKRVLLYGAGMTGRLLLDRMNSGTMPGLIPVGFLDDDPYLEGKKIHGYTVFGGHWKLQGLLNRTPVDEILLINERVKPEILRRLRHVARAHGTRLRRLNLTLEELALPEIQAPVEAHAPAPVEAYAPAHKITV